MNREIAQQLLKKMIFETNWFNTSKKTTYGTNFLNLPQFIKESLYSKNLLGARYLQSKSEQSPWPLEPLVTTINNK